MTTIQLTTKLQGTIEECFHASLDIGLELRAASQYSLQAIEGVTSGEIGLGQSVTWRTKQFGVWVRHRTEITRLEAPLLFEDTMREGLFRFFQHEHRFRALSRSETEMRDVLRFAMPPLLGGGVSERFLIERRLTHLLSLRNALLQRELGGHARSF